MLIHVFAHMREAGTGIGYDGWMDDSGYSIGLDNKSFSSISLALGKNKSRGDINIDWNSVYETKFKSSFTSFQVSPDMKVSDFTKKIMETRSDIFSYTNNVIFIHNSGSGYRSGIEFYHPFMGYHPLSGKLSLEDVGFIDGDIAVLVKTYSEFTSYLLNPAINAEKIFRSIVVSPEIELTPRGNIVNGLLLYTDEDTELATFVREHFASLDTLTGDWCTIYAIEQPPADWRNARQYWINLLEAHLYQVWGLTRWLTTKPYDRSEAYTVARQFGVYPDQLPCLVLLTNSASTPKLVFPISQPFNTFFRSLFSEFEQLLTTTNVELRTSDILIDNYLTLLTKLRDSPVVATHTERTQYIFQGNTAFVNRVEGTLFMDVHQEGDMYMSGSSKYSISGGNQGAVGDNAHAHDFNQVSSQQPEALDLEALTKELGALRQAARQEATDADHDMAIGQIAAAETAAKNSDEKGVLKHLASAGQWALDIASKIGVAIAVEALKKAMQL